jgi:hypothetical protein
MGQSEVKDAPLGHPWDRAELRRQVRAVFGGIAWPGRRPGFAVVAALGNEKHFDAYDIVLLDECESADTRELVRQCGVLDLKYRPDQWAGDPYNGAADRFLTELNDELRTKAEAVPARPGRPPPRQVWPVRSAILDMKEPYAYLLPQLKRLLDEDRRRLFLKDSRVKAAMRDVDPAEITHYEFGEFPAIEAVSLVVEALTEHAEYLDLDVPDDTSLAGSYVIDTVL